MSLFLLTLLGCKGELTGLLAEGMPAGVLLGAYSAGSEAIIVGGDFSGKGSVVRWDGENLCTDPDPFDQVLWWVHGTGTSWIAVGADGIVVESDGGTPVRADVDTDQTFFGVWVDGDQTWAVSSDIFASTGAIWRRQGTGPWEMVLETPDLMFKVWDGWFIGNGLAYYWDGSTFVERHPPDGARLTTIRGRGPDDVYAVGGLVNPVVLHWDGSAWNEIPWEPRCGGQNGLNGVWTAEGEDVWVAGHVGTAARWDGEQWSCNEAPVTGEDFHFVWKHDDRFLWGGGNLFASSDNRGVLAAHPAPRKPVEPGVCP